MEGEKDHRSETTMWEVSASPFLPGFMLFLLLQRQLAGPLEIQYNRALLDMQVMFSTQEKKYHTKKTNKKKDCFFFLDLFTNPN